MKLNKVFMYLSRLLDIKSLNSVEVLVCGDCKRKNVLPIFDLPVIS